MNITIMLVRTFIFAVLLVQAKPEGDAPTPSSLRLEMKLRKQSYCLRADRMNLSFDLQLRFTNTGEEPLIIYRKCDRPLKVNRSATASDALAGKFEESLEITPDFFYPHLVSGKEAFPPQDLFVILRPGETHFLNTTVGFSYCIPARGTCRALTEGEHYLQVTFGTWKEPLNLAKQLIALWRPFGLLWYKPVISQPMPFTVADQSSAELCLPPPRPGPII